MFGGRRLTRRRFSIGLGAGLSTLIAGPVFGETIDIKVSAQARGLVGDARTLSVLLPEGSRANLEPVAAVFTERTGVKVCQSASNHNPLSASNSDPPLGAR